MGLLDDMFCPRNEVLGVNSNQTLARTHNVNASQHPQDTCIVLGEQREWG